MMMRWNAHHKKATQVLIATVALDAALGVAYGMADDIHWAHGMYCALGTATTVGCDVPPATGAGYVLSAIMMLTVVPLFAAVFSFFTSGLTVDHVDTATQKQTDDLKAHVEEQTKSQTAEIKEHGRDNWRHVGKEHQ